jgi:superfamily II DNA/RNA helicase
VVDEADRMADMGFLPAVKRLLDMTSRDRQTILFSATLDGDVKVLTERYQRNPVRHLSDVQEDAASDVEHHVWKVERADRPAHVAHLVAAANPAIIFTRTRHGADRLAKQLDRAGVKAVALHGGRSQPQRNRALKEFISGRVAALVATDVAARGIHVEGVASVVHYDPPEDEKAYVHRSGRTARAGAEGIVVSIVQPGQKNEFQKMQRSIGLDEPFTRPDAGMLPEGALSGDRELAPAGPPPREPQERNRPANRSGRSQRKHGAPGRSRQGGSGRGDRSRDDRSRGGTGQGAKRSSSGNSSGKSGQSARNRKARRAHLQPTTHR